MNDFTKFLSLSDLADYLDIPKRTLYGWRYRGEGPVGHRLGGHVRFRRADVEEWLAAQREDPRPVDIGECGGLPS